MLIHAVAYKEGASSPYFISHDVPTIEDAIAELQDHAVLDNNAFIEIRVHDFVTKFHWGDFTLPQNYSPRS